MLCLLTLLVVAVLATFSARYRPLAREALDCVLRRMTLRKCTTGLDDRVRAAITGRVMRTHPHLARFLHRHLEALAWAFVLLFVASTAHLAYGFYNFTRYGSCYGPVRRGFCVFDPTGARSRYSGIRTGHREPPIAPGDGGAPSLGAPDARAVVIEFGCYTCAYTRAMQPVVDDLAARAGDRVRIVYRHFPLDGLAVSAGAPCEPPSRGWWSWREEAPTAAHPGATEAAVAATCAAAQGHFWALHRLLMTRGCSDLDARAAEAGLDLDAFAHCRADPASLDVVRRDFDDGVRAGLYGTPTFFVNGRMLVAPSAQALEDAVGAAQEETPQ
jgi:thiol-disulfide isomerase/thioredoxin